MGYVFALLPHQQRHHHFPARVFSRSCTISVLDAKKKWRKPSNASFSFSFDSWVKQSNTNSGGSAVESGIETARLLSDKKRQEVWKSDMKKQFPIIPAVFVDSFLDSMAEAFSAVAPSQLKKAMRPGGLEKVRPQIQASIIKSLKDQRLMSNLPLPTSEKDKILEGLVSMSLDLLLQDAKEILAEPSERLQGLEEQRRQVARYMTKRKLIWYEIRYHPIRTAFLSSLATVLAYLLYKEVRTTTIFKEASRSLVTFCTSLQAAYYKLFKEASRSVVAFCTSLQAAFSKLIPSRTRRIKRRPRPVRR
jgi:hypothetical protein